MSLFPRGISAAGLLLTTLLCASSLLPAWAQDDPQADLARLQTTLQDLEAERQRADTSLERERSRLRDDERTIRGATITTSQLEQARLEIATRRARVSSLRTRALARRDALSQVEDDISAQEGLLDSLQPDADGTAEAHAALDALNGQAEMLREIIDTLGTLRSIATLRTNLATQRLTLLQSRFELPDLNARPRPASAQSRQAQREIDQHLREAAAFRAQAADVGDDTLANAATRQLLELQAAEREDRAELLQTQLKIDRAGRILTTLDAFATAPATPIDVLEDGLDNVTAIAAELRAMDDVLARDIEILGDQRSIIEQQGRIATGEATTLEQRLELLDALLAGSSGTQEQIAAMRSRARASGERYTEALRDARNRELLTRDPLPADAYAWSNLAAGLGRLPGNIALALWGALTHAVDRVLTLRGGEWGAMIGVGLLLTLLAGLLRRGTGRLAARTRDSAHLLFAEAAALTPGIAVFAFLYWMTRHLGLNDQDRALWLIVAAIWPVGHAIHRSASSLASFFDEQTSAEDTRKFMRLLRQMLWVGGGLAAVLGLAHVVALSPSVEDAADRLSMLTLLVLAIPAIRLRQMVLKRTDADGARLRQVTLAVPALMIGTALVGLWGYVTLAWTIATGLALAAGVGFLWAAVRSMLVQSEALLVQRLQQRDEESAAFWTQNVVSPVSRLAQLGILILAVLVLGWMMGWSSQTPVIRSIPGWLDTTLFSIGASPIKLSSLVAAVVMVWLVFWAGGWSRQVSYRMAARKFADVGVRNSLSTFTQYAVVVFGLMVALKTIGLDLTALTVFAGALGVGIGFGLQTIVTNFISGILLLVERPLAVKDIVNVDKYEGEVTQIGIRSLTVKTWDSQEVIIPNSAVITKPFTNWTRSDDVMRSVVQVRVGYDADLDQALAICRQVLSDNSAVLETPTPAVRVWDFLDTGVLIWMQCHSRVRGSVNRAELRSQLHYAVWKGFRDAGIRIPYPRHEVQWSGDTAPPPAGLDAGSDSAPDTR